MHINARQPACKYIRKVGGRDEGYFVCLHRGNGGSKVGLALGAITHHHYFIYFAGRCFHRNLQYGVSVDSHLLVLKSYKRQDEQIGGIGQNGKLSFIVRYRTCSASFHAYGGAGKRVSLLIGNDALYFNNRGHGTGQRLRFLFFDDNRFIHYYVFKRLPGKTGIQSFP